MDASTSSSPVARPRIAVLFGGWLAPTQCLDKAGKAADLFQVIQTVDSPRLARRLNEAARALDVMIEVKLSAEESKAGAAPEDEGSDDNTQSGRQREG